MKTAPIPLLVSSLISSLAPFIALLPVFLTLPGCVNRAPYQRMLSERAEYQTEEDEVAESLKLSSDGALTTMDGAVPVRTPPKTANIWIYPHETPAKEYFWGGWVTAVVEGDRWDLQRPSDLPPEGAPIEPPSGKATRPQQR